MIAPNLYCCDGTPARAFFDSEFHMADFSDINDLTEIIRLLHRVERYLWQRQRYQTRLHALRHALHNQQITFSLAAPECAEIVERYIQLCEYRRDRAQARIAARPKKRARQTAPEPPPAQNAQ